MAVLFVSVNAKDRPAPYLYASIFHMKKQVHFFIFLLGFLITTLHVRADEGMWLPQLLQSLNESDMKKQGMKISARDIYSINNGSLKDAIVSLGGFCTAEVISVKF